MAAEPARLLGLAEAIAEGRTVDWGDAEASAGSDADRALIQQLRLLAGVADIHRATDADRALETADPIDPLVGRRWGALDIRGLIGKGSFGSVYRAWDPQLEREVALKLIRGGSFDGDQLLTEGKLLARVRHPHVVTVYGADRVDGRVGIWMELIQGRTLEEGLQQDGPLGAREAALIGIDLCGALAAVHGEGLVHRDVKARNVMREEGGRIVLMDFGAGRDRVHTRADAGAVGTPLYMAPETLRGAEASPSSDFYSLGVLLFRLVTGRFPVERRTSQAVADAHDSGTRRRMRDLRANLPAWFVAAIERAISPEPEKRFQTAAAFETALAVDHAPAVTVRRRILTAATIALVVLLAAGLAWSLRQNGFAGKTAPLHPTVSTIGVRPLRNLTGDPGQDLFATGLTEVLLSQLGAIRSLRILEVTDPVASRDGTQPPVPGVEAWLEGSVQRSGGTVRISARLLQAGTGAILWAQLEAPIAKRSCPAGGGGTCQERKVSVTRPSPAGSRRYDVDPQAVSAYLRGKYLPMLPVSMRPRRARNWNLPFGLIPVMRRHMPRWWPRTCSWATSVPCPPPTFVRWHQRRPTPRSGKIHCWRTPYWLARTSGSALTGTGPPLKRTINSPWI